MQAALEAGFNFRRIDATGVGIALDETVTRDELEALAAVLGGRLDAAPESVPAALRRNSAFCEAGGVQHPSLRARDAALSEAAGGQGHRAQPLMIPLGSCTMKLNAAAEMIADHLAGLRRDPSLRAGRPDRGLSDADRRAWRTGWRRVTGFAAVSLQPNAGSQGEYAGLLAIRAYHEARGEGQRDICLIPSSAHGTNPASAAMAGLQVVVVGCDRDGNVDLADLRAKVGAARGRTWRR